MGPHGRWNSTVFVSTGCVGAWLPHVVIVGAAFGGINAARRSRAPVQVTVIDQHNFHTFAAAYQVATAGSRRKTSPNTRGIVQRDLNVRIRWRRGART
jgi:NADH dehydrogenase FAD-containing subunit